MASKQLTILQVNDTHAYLDAHPELFWESGKRVYRQAGGYSRIAGIVKQIRREAGESLLFLDNGDTLHGTFPAVMSQGRVLVPILNRLGIDAMTAHWEFAYGPEVFRARASELEYPVLALNVKDKESSELVFPSYLVKEIAGLRVGIAGIASNIVDSMMPASFSQGLSFTLKKEELAAVVDQLRAQEQVDLVVLLSHLGFPQDLQLVGDVPGIDVCLSGHTHNRLRKPVYQGQTVVIQSGSHGSFLGRLDLEMDAGMPVVVRHELIEIHAGLEADLEIEQLVKDALAPYQEDLNSVVGETAGPLDRGLNLETTMDNLLLEALLDSSGAELAFSNGWRYGAPVLAGEIRLNDLYNIIPVNPPVSTVKLTGEEVVEMLEENLEHTFSRNPFLQMGGYVKRSLGLKVLFKAENPYPRRIQKVFIGKDEVEPGRTYTAAFVTEQGVPRKYGSRREKGTQKAVDAMCAYLQKRRPFRPELRDTFVLV